jgi:hypothetical protein
LAVAIVQTTPPKIRQGAEKINVVGNDNDELIVILRK